MTFRLGSARPVLRICARFRIIAPAITRGARAAAILGHVCVRACVRVFGGKRAGELGVRRRSAYRR